MVRLVRRRGQRRMKRGEIWFAATPGGDRPVLVLTRDPVTDRIGAVVVAALTRTEAWTGVGTEAAAGPRRGAYRLRGELRQPAYRPARRLAPPSHAAYRAAHGGSLPRRRADVGLPARQEAPHRDRRARRPAVSPVRPAPLLPPSPSPTRSPPPGTRTTRSYQASALTSPSAGRRQHRLYLLALPHPTPALQREHAPQGRGTDRPVHARLRWDPRWRRSRRAL